jgi:hypothetical protein
VGGRELRVSQVLQKDFQPLQLKVPLDKGVGLGSEGGFEGLEEFRTFLRLESKKYNIS